MTQEEIRAMTEEQYFWHMVSLEEFDHPGDMEELEHAVPVYGKGNRNRRIEINRGSGICTRCPLNGGENATRHPPRRDRYKTQRKGR